MVISCVAFNCVNKQSSVDESISFHRFPHKKPEILQKWVHAVKRKNWKPSRVSYICSKHFKAEDFLRKKGPNSRAKLQPYAVPSLFDFPIHLVKRSLPIKRKIANLSLIENNAQNLKRIVHDHAYGPLLPERKIKVLNSYIKIVKKKYMNLQDRRKKFKKRIVNLKSVIKVLKEELTLKPELEEILTSNFKNIILEVVKNEVRNARKKKLFFSRTIKAFAITLHYLSPKAYCFLQNHFVLPSERTLRTWCSNLKSEPGFTQQVFNKLRDLRIKNKILPDCVVILDEAAIRESMVYNSSKKCYEGFIDYGQGQTDGELPLASDVLVLMCVCIREHVKYPLGYFFTRKTDADTLSEIIKSCLLKLYDVGMKVRAIIFDGFISNICMAQNLGAKLCDGEIRPTFLHPSNFETCYVIYDPCHMLKLLRNALCDLSELYMEGRNNPIKWTYIEKLYELQNLEELDPATKLTKRHIEWKRHKMNVKLASQVFSNSVADALDFLRIDLELSEFKNSEETAEFIRLVNNVFDLLNSRSVLGKHYKQPLMVRNKNFWQPTFRKFIDVLSHLKDNKGNIMITGRWKTAFRGFIATIKSVEMLALDLLTNGNDYKYILCYRFSQDHLELFFNKIRQCGALNNNPNVVQFENAYRKVLLKNLVSGSKTGNCEIWADEMLGFLELLQNEDKNKDVPLEVNEMIP